MRIGRLRGPIIAALIIAIQTAGTPASAQVAAQLEGVGDVAYSVLPPELFAKTHSGKWVLLDGGTLPPASQLYQLLEREGRLDLMTSGEGAPKLFDARGMFLRGLNLNRAPGEGDPAGSARAVGSAQLDQVGKHNHPAIGYPENRRTGLATYDRFNAPRVDAATTKTTGDAGSNPARPEDTETRPKNIALYVYVKLAGGSTDAQ